MASDDQKKRHLHEKVDADLVFTLDEAGVPLAAQYDLSLQYPSVRRFAAMADSKTELRSALKADLHIDPDAGAAQRATMASLVTAWQACSDMAEKERQQRSEAKVLGVPRTLSYTDRNAMLHAYEKSYGHLEDREQPSSDYVALKVEEIEQGEFLASALDEVGSKDEALTLSVQSSVDAAGRLRVTRERKKSKLPKDSEELRAKLRLEATAMTMLGAKFQTRAWFVRLDPQVFANYAEYLLGEKCYRLQVPKADSEGTETLSPPWGVLLRYEQAVRKEAYKNAVRENRTIAETLPEACKNSEIKEIHFLSPTVLARRDMHTSSRVPGAEPPNPGKRKWNQQWDHQLTQLIQQAQAWGGYKGKGKQKGLAKGKTLSGRPDKKFGFLHSVTPDGKQICYKFQDNNCDGSCGRVHCCQVCLKTDHGRNDCPQKPSPKKPKQ